MRSRPRVALVLGSGGMKAIAHLGVLRAFAEAEIRPALYAGASAGAMVAAAAARGFSLAEMELVAERLRRDSVFRIDYANLLRFGLRTPALYRNDRILGLCADLFGRITFRDLQTALVVSTVEVESGAPVWWGLTGRRDVSVADAVYASCAMPGLLPPGRVGQQLCMDGAVRDPLGLGGVALYADLVVVVVLGGDPAMSTKRAFTGPAPALWWHAQSLVMRDLSRYTIERWDGPPLVVIRPEVDQVHTLHGADPAQLIQAGYDAAWKVLAQREGPVVALR